MRNTKQKNIILDVVNNSYDHLTAYQVYDLARNRISNISLGTVYRNLSNLVNEGKIRKLEVDGVDRFDRNIKHSHFICNKCGDVIDIFNDVLYDDEYIDGNLVMDYDIKIKGICRKCIGGN